MRYGPFAYPGYRWLWSGQLVSIIGDQLFPMAIVRIALDRPGPILSLGMIFGARFVALAALIVLGGVLADRLNKFRLMISSDVIRVAGVLALIGVGAGAPIWVLILVTFAMGAGESLLQPSYDALVPTLVPAEQLAKANAATTTLKNIGNIIGPGAAGVLVAAIGPTPALCLDAGTFGISTFTLLMLRYRLDTSAARARHTGGSILTDAAAGIRVVAQMPWLMALEIIAAVHVLLAVGPWFVLVPVIVQDRLGGTTGYGLLLSSFALGGLGGAATAGWIRKQLRLPGVWALGSLALFGIACLGFLITTATPVLAGLFVIAGAGTQFCDVLKATAIQTQTPAAMLGRVFALDFFASLVTMPAGQMLAGILVTGAHQAVTALAAAGTIVIATSLLGLLAPGVTTLGAPHKPPPGFLTLPQAGGAVRWCCWLAFTRSRFLWIVAGCGVWCAGGVARDVEIVAFDSVEAFEAWLGENHAASPGVWLKLRKKSPGIVALTYAQALEVALCYGWIDGQKAKFDEQWWLQRFTPRTARSKWSVINRDKALALIEQGRMRPAGQAHIDRAKADGRWEAAYAGSRAMAVPEDFAAALAADPVAAASFDTLDRQNRYAILYRIQDAKKPETRARRIAKYVVMLAEGKKLYS